MSYSLIMSDVVTLEGYKTFTMRWYKIDNISWYDIFDFISKKSGINKENHTVKIGNQYVKYNELNSIIPFDFNKFAFYDKLGKSTGCGLLKTGLNLIGDNKIINK